MVQSMENMYVTAFKIIMPKKTKYETKVEFINI